MIQIFYFFLYIVHLAHEQMSSSELSEQSFPPHRSIHTKLVKLSTSFFESNQIVAQRVGDRANKFHVDK